MGMADGGEIDAILHLVASGVSAAHRRLANGDPLDLPYPSALQRGLDRLTLRCLRAAAAPPAGVPELLRWCHRPAAEWLPADAGHDETGALLEHGIPTRTCEEWAISSADVEAELFERSLIDGVRRTCRNAGDQESYVAFRELVTRRPVLTELEFRRLLIDRKYALIAEHLQMCYPAVPAECVVGGEVLPCADCGNLLVTSRSGLVCVSDRCPRPGPARAGQPLPAVEGIRWLASPVRNFIASPGRAELGLRDALPRSVTVRLWPDFDATDLLVVFADGCRWAVDVKDWASPHLLARHLRPVPRSLEWERAFIVPSRSSVESRPGYLRDLRRQSRERLRNTGTEICSEQTLLAEVRRRAAEAVHA
jgi:hypothetical protein